MEQHQPPPTPPPPPPPTTKITSTLPHSGVNIIDRAKNILITPKEEWYKVDNELTPVSTVLGSYVLPMCLIGALATFIGQGLIGQNVPLVGSTASVKMGLIGALLFVALQVITVFIVAAAIDALSQTFASEKNWRKSFQLSAYSLTASYVGALFFIFPALNIIVIICTIYCVYPLYTGIPVIKKTTADKQVAYLAVIILITVVAVILVGVVQNEIIKSINRPQVPGLNLFGG